jgi:2-oxoisovalerate dehydrogenase E1 component
VASNHTTPHFTSQPGTPLNRSQGVAAFSDGGVVVAQAPSIAKPLDGRYPNRLSQEAFYRAAYRWMYYSRRMDERLFETFQKGYAKGTVTTGIGNEATSVGMTMPLRSGQDVVSVLHRDLASHLILGADPYKLFCQYFANAESPTHAREGNCHHGDAPKRRFPMISHLGKMLSLVVGGTWSARRAGESVFGLTVIGDGGTSTGEFHESINMASVLRVPVIFLIENNHYAFSTPTRAQFRCARLSDRAAGYAIEGKTIDGTDPWLVYSTVCDCLEGMAEDSAPRIIECDTVRLQGHAAYDKAGYVDPTQLEIWQRRDPVPRTRTALADLCGMGESSIEAIEDDVDELIEASVKRALAVGRPSPTTHPMSAYAQESPAQVPPYQAKRVKNGDAVNRALDFVLENDPRAVLLGLDIGVYGSAFKTCKGLIDRHGPNRVIDMPLCESAGIGFCLGASQVGSRPIYEFQFADFSTEACTQVGLNSSTWFFRSGQPAPLLLRLPCGGGLTMGAFHSGEFEGLWSRFSGLKLLYPATAQETFEALVAGFYDPNPCLVLEHKQLYWSKSGAIDFDGDLAKVWRCRKYRDGDELTVVAYGAMAHDCLQAADKTERSAEIINPFVLHPLDISPIVDSVRKTGRLLVVQESGETQGLGDRIISLVARECHDALKTSPQLISSPDLPIPFAPELEGHTRPSWERIALAIEQICRQGTSGDGRRAIH